MIAAGSGDDAGLRDLAAQQIRKCAAHFERTGMLQMLELEPQRSDAQAKIFAARFNDGR